MASWCDKVISGVAATILLLGTGTVANANIDEQVVVIPGARSLGAGPYAAPPPITGYQAIGIDFGNGPPPRVVDYSRDAFAVDASVADGLLRATVLVSEIGGKIVVIGESLGSMVAARLAVELANGADPPSTDDIRFVLIAPPEAGAAKYFAAGTFIPILNYRVSRMPESPYPTTMVIGEYDGWSDPPDRPWNLLALANAVLGMFFVHSSTAKADLDDIPPGNITEVTNSQGGRVTTILVPTKELPLTQPLRLIGIPDQLVDQLDRVLRPLIDAGYVRHDEPGDPRPYLSDGQIHYNMRWQPPVTEWHIQTAEQRQQGKTDANDRLVPRAQQLAEQKAAQCEQRSSIRSEQRRQISTSIGPGHGVNRALSASPPRVFSQSTGRRHKPFR